MNVTTEINKIVNILSDKIIELNKPVFMYSHLIDE